MNWGQMSDLGNFRDKISELRKLHGLLIAVDDVSSEIFSDTESFLELAISEGRPEKLPFGVSPRGAELYVSKWLEYLEFKSITITPPRRDGGYDIEADDFLVEVKNWNRDWLPVNAVREIFGVAVSMNKSSMVFSRGYLSEDARVFAEKNQIPVFLFNAEEALLEPGNEAAESLVKAQLLEKALRMQKDFAVVTGTSIANVVLTFCHELAETSKILLELNPEAFGKYLSGTAEQFLELAQNLQDFLESNVAVANRNSFTAELVARFGSSVMRQRSIEHFLQTQASKTVLDKARHVYENTSDLMEMLSDF